MTTNTRAPARVVSLAAHRRKRVRAGQHRFPLGFAIGLLTGVVVTILWPVRRAKERTAHRGAHRTPLTRTSALERCDRALGSRLLDVIP
jgi:hypothetical protein